MLITDNHLAVVNMLRLINIVFVGKLILHMVLNLFN